MEFSSCLHHGELKTAKGGNRILFSNWDIKSRITPEQQEIPGTARESAGIDRDRAGIARDRSGIARDKRHFNSFNLAAGASLRIQYQIEKLITSSSSSSA